MATSESRTAVLAHPHELADLERTPTREYATEADDKKELSVYAPTEPVPHQVTDTPLKLRLIALSCILFFTTGAAFAESTLGPLKSTFVRELKINSTLPLLRCPPHD